MLGSTGHAEKIGDAADGQDQGVIRYCALRQNGVALLIQHGGYRDRLIDPVEVKHLALLEFKMMPACLRNVLQLVGIRIHAAGSDFMQQRLPQVGGRTVNQYDMRFLVLAQLISQPGDQLQSACSPADHNDSVQQLIRRLGIGPGRVCSDFHGGLDRRDSHNKVAIVTTVTFTAPKLFQATSKQPGARDSSQP